MLAAGRRVNKIKYRHLRVVHQLGVRAFTSQVKRIESAERKAIEIAKVDVRDFEKPSSMTPVLTVDIEGAKKFAKMLDYADSLVEYDSTLDSHKYVCLYRLGSLKTIQATTAVPMEILRGVLGHPMFWMDAWFLNVPFGGARFMTERPTMISDTTTAELRLMGLRVGPTADPIRVSHIKSGLYVGQQLLAPELTGVDVNAIAYDALLHAFLARTLWGHALIGSVAHNLLLYQDQLFAQWFGAGYGVPILGGKFNNIVACNEWIGTWPRLASNLREAFLMKDFWMALHSVYQHKDPVDQMLALQRLAWRVSLQRPAKSIAINATGVLHTSGGLVVRPVSSAYGEIVKAMSFMRGQEFTGLKH